jgi:hypothetical protein
VTGALQTIVQRSSRYRADAAASRNDPHRAAGTNITAPDRRPLNHATADH